MPLPKLYSPDGRRAIQPSSKEEGKELTEQGYTTKEPGKVETANSGAEGHRRARASSTTEGAERNTGSTVPDLPPGPTPKSAKN